MAEDNRSLIELPRVNLEGVLIKLPLPSLLVCCCVSKSLLNLIKNDSDFARMHLAKSEPQLMIQSHLYSTIHLIDLDTNIASRVDVKPNFNIPLPGFQVTDSSNGLVLLESRGETNDFHRCILYNPVTGEYTLLPETETLYRGFISALFYCPETNKFQVLCTFYRVSPDPDVSSHSFKELDPSSDPDSDSGSGSVPELIVLSDSDSDSDSAPEVIVISDRDTDSEVPEHYSDSDSDAGSVYSDSDALGEIYVGGSNSWESLGILPFSPVSIYNSCHLDQTVHWICWDETVPSVIVSFNFESHEFGEIPGPMHVHKDHVAEYQNFTLVALNNCLSIFDNYTSNREITVWVMKEYGVQDSWIKEYVIGTTLWGIIGIHRHITPFICRNNGEVVMVSEHGYIMFYDLLEKRGRTLSHPPLEFQRSIVVHTPSLVSLRDVVRGSNLEVVKVAPRLAGHGLNPYNYLELSKVFIE